MIGQTNKRNKKIYYTDPKTHNI